MHLKHRQLRKLDTETLFGISLILGNPRIQTKANFVEELSGVKINKSQQAQIKNLVALNKQNFKKDDLILANGYYIANRGLVSFPAYDLQCKILTVNNKTVYARVQKIINHSPLSPVLLSTIEIPISKCRKA